MDKRPIIMSASMINALLAGRKTQTRRVIKPQPELQENGSWHIRGCGGGLLNVAQEDIADHLPDYVPYAVGDRLWVRETWAAWMHAPAISVETMAGQLSRSEIAYKATDDGWDKLIADRNALRDFALKYEDGSVGNWVVRSASAMPRWASRLTLDVTDVRVQRLQDISEEDAKAEGMIHRFPTAEETTAHKQWCEDSDGEHVFDPVEDTKGLWYAPGSRCGFGLTKANRDAMQWAPTAACAFRFTWEAIHGADAWAENPWVAALSFTVHHGNIDAPVAEREAADA